MELLAGQLGSSLRMTPSMNQRTLQYFKMINDDKTFSSPTLSICWDTRKLGHKTMSRLTDRYMVIFMNEKIKS